MRYLPSRLELAGKQKEKKQIELSNISGLVPVDPEHEVLIKLKTTIAQIEEVLTKANQKSTPLADHKEMLERLSEMESLLVELKNKTAQIEGKERKIVVSSIVPNWLKDDLQDINKAIKTLASFETSIIPEGQDFISFDTPESAQDKPDFWVQDKFLVFEKHANGEICPVDDSLGRIEHIAFIYYSNPDEGLDFPFNTRNSYNKVYVDLILKMARVFKNMPALKKEAKRPRIALLENRTESKSDNAAEVYEGVHQQTVKLTGSPDLIFKGGNVLFIGGYALIGYDSVLESYFKDYKEITKQFKGMYTDKKLHKAFNKKMDAFAKAFKTSFSNSTSIPESHIIFIGSKEIIYQSMHAKVSGHRGLAADLEEHNWIGGDSCFSQWIYHIDLFINGAGKDEIDINKSNRIFVGQPVNTENVYSPLYELTKKFTDEVADQLTEKGFTVYRNPLPLTYIHSNEEGGKIRKKWFLASYNNCIVQYTKKIEDRYVWLPVYGSDFSNEYIMIDGEKMNCGDWSHLKSYDLENKRIWESIGFKVQMLTNYLPFAMLRGATRCLSKVLQRGPLEE